MITSEVLHINLNTIIIRDILSDAPRGKDITYSMNLNNDLNIIYEVTNSPQSRIKKIKIRTLLYVHLQRCNQLIDVNDV